MKKVIVERVVHYGVNRIAIRFPYDAELSAIVKKLPDARWSSTLKCWHVPDRDDMLTGLFRLFKGQAFLDYSALRNVNKPEPGRKQESKSELPALSEGDVVLNLKNSVNGWFTGGTAIRL